MGHPGAEDDHVAVLRRAPLAVPDVAPLFHPMDRQHGRVGLQRVGLGQPQRLAPQHPQRYDIECGAQIGHLVVAEVGRPDGGGISVQVDPRLLDRRERPNPQYGPAPALTHPVAGAPARTLPAGIADRGDLRAAGLPAGRFSSAPRMSSRRSRSAVRMVSSASSASRSGCCRPTQCRDVKPCSTSGTGVRASAASRCSASVEAMVRMKRGTNASSSASQSAMVA